MAETEEGTLRVTQVLYSGLGGHASVAFSLIAGDRDRRWSPSLLFVGVEPLAPAYRQHSEKLRIPFDAVQVRPGQPWYSWPAIYRALRRFAPDAVALHSISSLPPVLLYRLFHGARIIAVEHTAHLLKTRAERLMSAIALVFAERVVVLTPQYRAQHLESIKSLKLAQKIVVVPNGVDVSAFIRPVDMPQSAVCRIGMAGRFTSSKRQDLLVAALALLNEYSQAVRWQLTFAGDGDRLAAVRGLAEAAGVSDQVEFAGHVDEDQIVEWFRSLNLYAHASDAETLSTSMLQAMSMGLPIVASRAPGITNLLQPPELRLGVLADNSAPAFAAAISAVHADAELRTRLAVSCRAHACEVYSQEAMFKSYDALVKESLN